MSQPKETKPKEAGGPPAGKTPMDIKHIKSLIELMVSNDLSRIELREGDTHILLRRGHAVAHTTPVAPPAAAAPSANPAPAARPAPTEAPADTSKEVFIRSPMVGTFYVSPEPDAPPFVSIGTTIGPDSVVCLIEAMKVFNEIKAEASGRITKILAKNAQAVEYDQPLFAVEPA